MAWLLPDPTQDNAPRVLEFLLDGHRPPAGSQRVGVGFSEALLEALARLSMEERKLSPGARLLLELICLLELPDRWRWLVEPSLSALWSEFGLLGVPPELDRALRELTDQGLIAVKDGYGDGVPTQHHHVDEPVMREVVAAVDRERARRITYSVGQHWAARFLREEASPTRHTVRAGIGASVYARRLGQFAAAFELLQNRVLRVAERTGEARFVFMHLEMIAETSRDPQLVRKLEEIRAGNAR
jgi:hypothetical protein